MMVVIEVAGDVYIAINVWNLSPPTTSSRFPSQSKFGVFWDMLRHHSLICEIRPPKNSRFQNGKIVLRTRSSYFFSAPLT